MLTQKQHQTANDGQISVLLTSNADGIVPVFSSIEELS